LSDPSANDREERDRQEMTKDKVRERDGRAPEVHENAGTQARSDAQRGSETSRVQRIEPAPNYDDGSKGGARE
jgi:hypothetical protein